MRSAEFISPKKLTEAELYDVRWRKTIVQGQTVWEVLLTDGSVEYRPWSFGQQRPPNLKPMPGFPNGNPNWEHGRTPTVPSTVPVDPPGSIPIPQPEPAKTTPSPQNPPSIDVSGSSPPPPPFSTAQIDIAANRQGLGTKPPRSTANQYAGSAGAQAIMAANSDRIKDVNKIRAGDIINIPGKGQYKIAPGDTLNAIAAGRGRGQIVPVRT